MVSTAQYKTAFVVGTVASTTMYKLPPSWEQWSVLPFIKLPQSWEQWPVLP